MGTDLDQRVHRNQETLSLGKMAFGILRTFLARSQAKGMMINMEQVSTILRQFQAHDDKYE
jgi:glucosyl-3-phosphoglycerate synthase